MDPRNAARCRCIPWLLLLGWLMVGRCLCVGRTTELKTTELKTPERKTTELKTIELKSNAITLTRDGIRTSGQRRTKRSVFPAEMKQRLVDKHNDLRRLEGASDMEYMTWNEYLASMAEDWAKECRWEHGQPYRPPNEAPFEQIGQNLYVYNGTFDPLVGIQLFYDEVAYYDYNTGACSKPPCGHYTQVVWSTSREVGCAYAFCSRMANTDLINANYLVCNYGPAGNYVGKKPFKKGAQCTQCETGRFWCDEGLCRRDCTQQSTKCQCKAACKNCASVVPSNCSCRCAAGWTGVDCSERCEDRHEYCGANPGWPLSWCDKDYVRTYCPAMCSLCTPSTGTDGGVCITTSPTTPSTTSSTTPSTTPPTTPSTTPSTSPSTTPSTTPKCTDDVDCEISSASAGLSAGYVTLAVFSRLLYILN